MSQSWQETEGRSSFRISYTERLQKLQQVVPQMQFMFLYTI